PDLAHVEVATSDEILQYLNARYISPTEAAWRIYKFPTHDRYPDVMRLELHLPDQYR
ncbi:hypothetical protein BGW41_007133, partial [Actinomortierella wolfii]